MKLLFIGLLALGSISAYAQEYSLGCGTIKYFEIDRLLAEQGVRSTYKLELEISKGIHTSSYVRGAELIKKIKPLKDESKQVCVDTSYDADLESSFVSIVDEIKH